MTQPELGRKIAELRKARGLTQEELVEKCRLSVRTLQRIESGEVIPRSHTIRVIFEALEYEVFDSVPVSPSAWKMKLQNLFNLKINTMQKISILTVAIAATALILVTQATESKAQDRTGAEDYIRSMTANFIRWHNNAQIDSIVSIYADDACILAMGCGKPAIRRFYETQGGIFYFKDFRVTSVSVADSIAVEKGRWTVDFNGAEFRGEYMTEWRYRNKRWLIVNDISDNY